MRTRAHIAAAVVALALAGCSDQPADDMDMEADLEPCGAALAGKADGAKPADPNVVPSSIAKWQRTNNWGRMHIDFHVSRRWDIMSADGRSWATGQGIRRNTLQEGAPTSGLEFLAMHRQMLGAMRKAFPRSAAIFAGFDKIPTDPADAKYPLPQGGRQAFDPNMLKALARLQDNLKDFATDDDFGLYLQTNLRPTAGKPTAKSSDSSTGVHNYLHVRWSDSSSPINVGDPSVNLENRVFWAIHGWIDARWTAYRAARGLNDSTDAAYQQALKSADEMMLHAVHMKADGASECIDVPVAIQGEFFAQ